MENWNTAYLSLIHIQMQHITVFITCVSGELLNQTGTSLMGKKNMWVTKVRVAILDQSAVSSNSVSFLGQGPVRDAEVRLQEQGKHAAMLCQNALPAINSFRTAQTRSICSCILPANDVLFYEFVWLLFEPG